MPHDYQYWISLLIQFTQHFSVFLTDILFSEFDPFITLCSHIISLIAADSAILFLGWKHNYFQVNFG